MTLSTYITLSRVVLSALVMVCLYPQTWLGNLAALIVFVIASLTDYWDGAVARRRGETSALGALLDPVADKCLVLAALWSFVLLGLVPLWMVIVITAREVAVTVARLIKMPTRVVEAVWSGKQKTVWQMIACHVVLVMLAVDSALVAAGVDWQLAQWPLMHSTIWLLMLWATAMTVISGLHIAAQWHESPGASAGQANRAYSHPAVFLSTVGGAGLMPWAPGLAGSAVGLLIAYVLRVHPWLAAAKIVGILAVACWAVPRTERLLQSEDAPVIVIDETLGMLVALWLVPWSWPAALAGLVLFRALDVLKPWGLRQLERLRTPWGVLLDDVACGVLVNVVLQVVVRGFVR